MRFKNEFEARCFQIASRALGTPSITVEHNKRIQIESALFPEVASFKGPPRKEIDVLVAELLGRPKIVLLVSCKDISKRVEPAHVQEWAAVVTTMNRYSEGTVHLGLVISPTGFTDGCEAWATSHNLGIIPPLKGRRLVFSPDTVFRMFERTLEALSKRVRLNIADLTKAPAFFDFVYLLTSDFEGREEAAQDARYFVHPRGWLSSFGEMYSSLAGHIIEDLVVTDEGATILNLSDGWGLRFSGARVEFGQGIKPSAAPLPSPSCRKNLDGEPCELEFIRSIARGKRLTSAADFGSYIEFGLDQRFNLGLHVGGVHIISTDSPATAL